MSDSSIDDTKGPIVLCSQCQLKVNIADPKPHKHLAELPQPAPTASATSQMMLGSGQH